MKVPASSQSRKTGRPGGITLLAAVLLAACATGGRATRQTGRSGAKAFTAAAMTDQFFTIEQALADPARLAQLHQQYERQVQVDPQHPFKRFLWAYTLNDRNQAWAELTKITKLNSKFYWAYLGMGVILDGWGVYDQAEHNFSRAVDLAPRLAVGYALFGRMYLHKKEAGRAVELLERAVRLAPGRNLYHLYLARARRLAGNVKGAEKSYQQVLAGAADNFAALRELGLLLAENGQVEKAIELLGRAVEQRPRACPERLKRAQLLAGLAKRGNEALDEYQQACDCLGKDKKCWKEQAALAARLHREQERQRAWEKVLDIDAGDLEACKYLGPVYLAAGAIEKALPVFQQIRKREPDNLEALRGLAVIFEKGGEYSAAIELAEQVLAAQPDDQVAGEIRSRLFARFHILDEPVSGRSPQQVFSRVRAQIAKVYKLRLEKKPALKGELLIKVTVVDDGRVSQVALARDTVSDLVVNTCAVWNLRRARFPKGFGATYDFALTLKPGD